MTTTHCGRPAPDFPSLLEHIGAAELASPLRSTVPLLAYWRTPTDALASFLGLLGLPAAASANLAFEHPTPVRRGQGKASYTDLMLTTDGVAIAVEAKAKEPPYPTVREWLGEPPPKNRLQVLQGWLELIGRVVGAPVQGADVEDCSYQLIHRTASACAFAAAPRLVVYHCFDAEPSMLDYYRAQLGRLRAGIGDTPGLDLCVVHTAIEPTAEYTRLMDSWHSGHRELASQVRQALLDGAIRVGGSDMIARV